MRKLITLTILISFILSSYVPFVEATDTASEVRDQINSLNDQIKELDKEIAQYKSQINKTSEQSNTLSKIIKELTLTRDKLLKEKTQTEKRITATGLVIRELNSDILTKEEVITESKKAISKMLVSLYQQESETVMEKILAKKNLEEMSREYNNIISFNDKVRDQIKSLNNEKTELTVVKSQKVDEQDRLTELKNDLNQKALAVGLTQKEKNKILTETKNKEAEYQKLLAERIKKRDAFEKDLSLYEDKLKFILNPKTLPKEGSAVFSWPLSYVYVTQLFGVTSASKRLYKSGSHSGLDFRASLGTPVMAMASGTVMGVGDTDLYCKGASFGKWVFIKYDNGLSSTYGHLSSISVKSGNKVKAGTVVGLSGNTGHSTGPHLHVTVYASDGVKVDTVPSISCSGKTFIMPIAASTSYLDPALYLPPITKDKLKP